MKINFYGLGRFYENHAEELKRLLDNAGHSGMFISGSITAAFEAQLASYSSHKHAIAVGSCTDSLYFSLLAAGIKPGDEVIVPSFSFIATVTPVIQAGAIPVFTDILPETLSMCPDDLKRKITPKTKAVIFVHLFGMACPLDSITETCSQHNLTLIEDNAHSLGSHPPTQKKPGTYGHFSCVSFDPTKVISAFGTGGALLTSNTEAAAYVKMLRSQGKNPDSKTYEISGYNSRISEFQAAFLSYQLSFVDELIQKRRSIAQVYNTAIFENPYMYALQKGYSAFHKYVLVSPYRDDLRKHLYEKGIETMIHYDRPLFEYPLFKNVKHRAKNIKTVYEYTSRVLSLPIYPELSESETSHIAESIRHFKPKV